MSLYKLTQKETRVFFQLAKEVKSKTQIIEKMSPKLQGFIQRWKSRHQQDV